MPSGRIVVIDDHAIFSSLICFALVDLGYTPVAGDPLALSDDELVALGDGDGDCLVVLDLALGPGHAPYELIRRFVEGGHRVVVLTASDESAVHGRAVASGASAVVEKVGSLDRFTEVLQAVAEGGAVLTELQRRAVEHSPDPDGFATLTRREEDVLAALLRGRAPKDIASELSVALPTVRTQIQSIYRKLNVNNQRAALLLAVEVGWKISR